MPNTYPDITSPPLRRRMAQSLNNLRCRWILKCGRPDFFSVRVRRDMIRFGIYEMARLEQALDDEQDRRIDWPIHWEIDNPVTLINHDIDRLMQRLPALPAWAAHQICGWDWLHRNERESAQAYVRQAQAETEANHREGAHR